MEALETRKILTASSYLEHPLENNGNRSNSSELTEYEMYYSSFNNNSSYSSNDTNYLDFEYIQYPMLFQICIYIMYNLVFVGAVVGNLLVIYVVGWSRRMRTVTNLLIGNLAVGDLLMALLCVPFSYIPVLLQYWPFGSLLCYLVTPAQAVCVFVSAYTLVALAIDRYMAILYPLRPRLRRSQALVVIAVIWAVAFLTAVPIALFTRINVDPARGLPLCEESGWWDEGWKMGYGLSLLVLQYFFPITVLIYTYSRIALEIWWKKKPLEATGDIVRVFQESREQRLTKARRKTVVMTLCVVAGYTLAWLPLNLFVLYLETLTYDAEEEILPYLEYVFFVCHFLAMAHTTYNPIIYAWVNSKFRDAFANVFNNLLGRRKGIGGEGSHLHNHLLNNQHGGSSVLSRAAQEPKIHDRIINVETKLIGHPSLNKDV